MPTYQITNIGRTLTLRLADEREWQHQFPASGPDQLAAGCRAAWVAYVGRDAAPGDPVLHPVFELRRRLGEIDAWIAERRARSGATDDARASWERQADHWRYQARTTYGGGPRVLRLHVQAADGGSWCLPADMTDAAYVSAAGPTPEEAEILWERCVAMFEHTARIGRMGELVEERTLDALRPALLTVVPPPEDP